MPTSRGIRWATMPNGARLPVGADGRIIGNRRNGSPVEVGSRRHIAYPAHHYLVQHNSGMPEEVMTSRQLVSYAQDIIGANLDEEFIQDNFPDKVCYTCADASRIIAWLDGIEVKYIGLKVVKSKVGFMQSNSIGDFPRKKVVSK